ncbi:SDR family oxidoreductase [Chloroflexota bacterium]
MNKKEKVVITGGAGFIGSHLIERLLEKGYAVIVLDDLSSGNIENIERFIDDNSIEFVRGSVTDLPLLERSFQGVRYVFYLAAIPGVLQSVINPMPSHEIILGGLLNALIAAKDNQVDKVIYASSSSVYGDTPTLPKEEGMIPNPLSPYAAMKLAAEYYCRAFYKVYQLKTVCLRYFNVYGPRQSSQYAAVIPEFITAVNNGKATVIEGDGKQTRDFTYVKDAVEATVLSAESDAIGEYNIARGESITINELAKLIMRLTGRDVEIIHEAPRPGDVKHSLADISRAKTFGYQPEFSLEDGLSETIRWFNDGQD